MEKPGFVIDVTEFTMCDFSSGPCVVPGSHTYTEARVFQPIVSFPDHETDQIGIGSVDVQHPFEYKR